MKTVLLAIVLCAVLSTRAIGSEDVEFVIPPIGGIYLGMTTKTIKNTFPNTKCISAKEHLAVEASDYNQSLELSKKYRKQGWDGEDRPQAVRPSDYELEHIRSAEMMRDKGSYGIDVYMLSHFYDTVCEARGWASKNDAVVGGKELVLMFKIRRNKLEEVIIESLNTEPRQIAFNLRPVIEGKNTEVFGLSEDERAYYLSIVLALGMKDKFGNRIGVITSPSVADSTRIALYSKYYLFQYVLKFRQRDL